MFVFVGVCSSGEGAASVPGDEQAKKTPGIRKRRRERYQNRLLVSMVNNTKLKE